MCTILHGFEQSLLEHMARKCHGCCLRTPGNPPLLPRDRDEGALGALLDRIVDRRLAPIRELLGSERATRELLVVLAATLSAAALVRGRLVLASALVLTALLVKGTGTSNLKITLEWGESLSE